MPLVGSTTEIWRRAGCDLCLMERGGLGTSEVGGKDWEL